MIRQAAYKNLLYAFHGCGQRRGAKMDENHVLIRYIHYCLKALTTKYDIAYICDNFIALGEPSLRPCHPLYAHLIESLIYYMSNFKVFSSSVRLQLSNAMQLKYRNWIPDKRNSESIMIGNLNSCRRVKKCSCAVVSVRSRWEEEMQ